MLGFIFLITGLAFLAITCPIIEALKTKDVPYILGVIAVIAMYLVIMFVEFSLVD